MLLMLLIGWVVLLPAFLVAGLYVTSSVLGRRRGVRAYDDLLLEDDQASDAAARWSARGSRSDAEWPVAGPPSRAPQSAPQVPESGPSPVAARY
jgi:hypothetical protein